MFKVDGYLHASAVEGVGEAGVDVGEATHRQTLWSINTKHNNRPALGFNIDNLWLV